jgi:hypothetical protein
MLLLRVLLGDMSESGLSQHRDQGQLQINGPTIGHNNVVVG